MRTLVFQSCAPGPRAAWIDLCLESARAWSADRGFAYRLAGDEMLELVPASLTRRAGVQRVMLADLGRLLLARRLLDEGWPRVVWMDADLLVFRPAALVLPDGAGHAFGRELWLQEDESGRLRLYRNVHNAVCLFEAGDPLLDFYIHACQRILDRLQGGAPPQLLGPKLLTALHNIVGFPLLESVGALSPPVLRDLAAGGGPALDRLRRESGGTLAAANLCASLLGAGDEALLEEVCRTLLASEGAALSG